MSKSRSSLIESNWQYWDSYAMAESIADDESMTFETSYSDENEAAKKERAKAIALEWVNNPAHVRSL